MGSVDEVKDQNIIQVNMDSDDSDLEWLEHQRSARIYDVILNNNINVELYNVGSYPLSEDDMFKWNDDSGEFLIPRSPLPAEGDSFKVLFHNA